VVQSPSHAALSRDVLVGEVLSSHQFILEHGGYITGKVVVEDLKPISGAAVGWAQPASAGGQDDRIHGLSAMTATAEDGSFRLGPLPPGEFQITAMADSPRRMGKVAVRVGGAKVIMVKP